MAMFKFKACAKCNGDLVQDCQDTQDWYCVQCGHYYYGTAGAPKMAIEGRRISNERPINTFIGTKEAWDNRWMEVHPELVKFFDQGLSLRSIAYRTGHSVNVLKSYRDRWLEIRTKQLIG